MKKKLAAVMLSLALSVSMISPAYTSDDFLEDVDTSFTEYGEYEIPVEDITVSELEEEPAKVEEISAEPDVQEADGDFFAEIDMKDLLAAEEPEEEPEVPTDEDFLFEASEELPMLGELSDGWEARTVGNEYKYLLAKGTKDGSGNAEYYTAADGLVNLKGKTYYFDANGYMVTGPAEAEGKKLFFMTAEKAALLPNMTGEPTPLNSDLGQMKRGCWYWDGTAFSYYGANGEFMPINDLIELRKQQGLYVGYFKIDGYCFVLSADGVPHVGDYEITEGTRQGLYFFQAEKNEDGYVGAMAVSTWVKIVNTAGARWRYYDVTGRTELGIKATKLDSEIDPSVGDNIYLLSAGGYVYQKAAMREAMDGHTYACNADGIVYTDKIVKFADVRYYMDSQGRQAALKNCWRWIPSAGNKLFYFGENPGQIVERTGWVKISSLSGETSQWYYFSASGNPAGPGWVGDYYFDGQCALATGFQTVGGKTYYLTPSAGENHNGKCVKDTQFELNGKSYYASADGSLYKSRWVTIDGNDYYYQSDCSLAKNSFAKKGDSYGYLDTTGKFTTGWVISNASQNKIRYINTSAAGFVMNDYRIVDGVRYYFDANGFRVSDLTSYYPEGWEDDPVLVNIHNGSYAPYYLECDKTNGVITVYTDSTKSLPIRTIRTSVGNPTSLTVSGTFTMTPSLRWQPLMGPSWGQYGTHVVNGIFVHSVACNEANCYNLPASAYDMLGSPASHGCMRVCVADAKWVYENCNRATIRVYDGSWQSQECFKGPLGRKPLVPRFGAGNFDPTDPAVVG